MLYGRWCQYIKRLAAMISFFALFIPVTVFTLFAHSGNGALHRQRDELLPLLNFEPFVYLLFLVAGLSILFASRSRLPNWFASFFIVPFAGALSGWGFGLTLGVLFSGQWRSALIGLALTAFVAVFCLAPAVINRLAIDFAQDILGRLFPKRHQVLAVYSMGVVLVAASAVGLWGLYGG